MNNGTTDYQWTDERIELLTQLWKAGKTVKQIMAGLPPGVTRNGVLGKVHRLGLARREAPQSIKAAQERRMAREAMMTIDRMTADACRWPLGAFDEPARVFCGAPVSPERPYCPAHCAIAYQPPKKLHKPLRFKLPAGGTNRFNL